MFEVGFELVSSTMPNVMVLPTELPGGVKYRSITQPRISLIAFSPPWNGGMFEAYRLTGLRIRSYVPTQTSIQILGTQGDMLKITRTRKHFF